MSVASWEIDRPQTGWIWIGILAIERDHRRTGLGLVTKEFVLSTARNSSYTHAMSQVHVDNLPMIMLNDALGADRRRRPWPNDEWFVCTIALA